MKKQQGIVACTVIELADGGRIFIKYRHGGPVLRLERYIMAPVRGRPEAFGYRKIQTLRANAPR